MKEKYKIFVWEGPMVLRDYSHGMIVAIARNLGEALEKIGQKEDYAMGNFPVNDYKTYPIDKTNAWMVWGGG